MHLNPQRILIVEDETIVARDIAAQLNALGYDPVATVRSGEECIAFAEKYLPDLVLIDIHLAGEMDGVTAALYLRQSLGLPIVFLTAFEADDILAQAKLSEPYGYILKPFTDRELRTVLEMAFYKCQIEATQKRSALRHQFILNNINDCVITINQLGEVESFNRAAESLFGYRAQELIGQNVSLLICDACQDGHRKVLDGYLQKTTCYGGRELKNLEAVKHDGTVFSVSISLSAFELHGQVTIIELIRDITQNIKDEEEINHLAFYDPLTDLPNRRLLLERLSQAILVSVREKKHGALLFLDLDNFKELNDSLGHQLGDELLKQVSRRLQHCVRECDTISRLGGDEFLLLLEGLSENFSDAMNQAKVIANKILTEINRPFELLQHNYNSSASIGIVLFLDGDQRREDIIQKADIAMYQAKAAGRNVARFFDPQMQSVALARDKLEFSLRTAIENNEFYLDYQVQVNEHHVPIGAEALLRWRSDKYGSIEPNTFIPLAEDSGVMLEISQWVLQESCKQLARWAKSFDKRHWTLSVNLSLTQMAHPDFVGQVCEAMQQNNAIPSCLRLELTESMLLKNIDDIVIKMQTLSKLGVTFSLDDFGTGYSSLYALKRLPIDTIKIDQSFIHGLVLNEGNAVIAKSIIALGHCLGARVLAEGVETQAERDYLVSQGCDAYQGFYFGKPVPEAQLMECSQANTHQH